MLTFYYTRAIGFVPAVKWYNVTDMKRHFDNEKELAAFGAKIGQYLKGGEVLELVGDIGAGKTTLTKAIARGMGILGPIQSPTFTISNRYTAQGGIILAHYDFYRLQDAGLMSDELYEAIHDKETVTIIEWADIVSGVLPSHRVTMRIIPVDETGRDIEMITHDEAPEFIKELA